ncbi:hypothetical protein RD110_07915 [Rhodoferax koreense]|uniref:Uncharacterized protein n=1 Tax=Rhodoferax koreensis TaxID=1842727 RepID=A0A1P8JTR0_9BURK|nr:hypothetical protein [Rhodoferax koreense]APW37129.1 hypothetical protein RD110_07915 [Rhodoferax koreense]
MTIKIPPRKYLTFKELVDRWQCTDSDLRYLVVNGEMKPSFKATEPLNVPDWEFDSFSGACIPSDKMSGIEGYDLEILPGGWLYLQSPQVIAPLDCRFELASSARDPKVPEDENDGPLGSWFWLTVPLGMDEVQEKCAFVMEEVLRYESRHDQETPNAEIEKPLGNRERDTLLCIIGTVCTIAGIDFKKSSKSAAQIQHAAAQLGVSIGDSTIEGHLKKAREALGSRMK